MKARLLILVPIMANATPALAVSNDEVRAALEQRFKDGPPAPASPPA